MVAGSLGPTINMQDIGIAGDGLAIAIKVNDSFIVTSLNFAGTMSILVYSVSPAFVLAQTCNLNAGAYAAFPHSFIRLGNTNNFATFANSTVSGKQRVDTFNVSANGLVVNPLAHLDFGAGIKPFRCNALHITGTIYACVEEDAGLQITLNTFSISDDGLTITAIGTDSDGLLSGGPSVYGDFRMISGSTYAILRQDSFNGTYLTFYNIDAAGAITRLNRYNIDTGNGGEVALLPLYGTSTQTLLVLAYVTAAGANSRIRTYYAYPGGLLGSTILNTNDAVFAFGVGNGPCLGYLKYMGSNIVFLPYEKSTNKSHIVSFPVSIAGIIGAPIDDQEIFAIAISCAPRMDIFKGVVTYGTLGDNAISTRIFTDNGGMSYTITATAIGQGSIAPSGNVAVLSGGNQNFVFTPVAGYGVSSVVVDGVSQPITSSYLFSNVIYDHTITVTFSAIDTPANISHAESREPLPV